MNKGRVIYEDEAEAYFRLAYPSPALASFVDYYFEIRQPASIVSPLYLNALPNLSSLICVSLHPTSWLSINPQTGILKTVQGSRFLGNLTQLTTSIYPGGAHEFYIKFKPGVLAQLYHLTNQDVENANTELAVFMPPQVLEEPLQTAHSFAERIGKVEPILLERLVYFEQNYRFKVVQSALARFEANPGHYRHLDRICRELGVSYPSLHRYFTDVLGYSPKYCQKVIRFKKALQRYQQHGSQYPFEEMGYTDFSHFLKESRQLTLRRPSEL
ncbi:helix-turn-helix domain-containing protein [Larkinella harenae]